MANVVGICFQPHGNLDTVIKTIQRPHPCACTCTGMSACMDEMQKREEETQLTKYLILQLKKIKTNPGLLQTLQDGLGAVHCYEPEFWVKIAYMTF